MKFNNLSKLKSLYKNDEFATNMNQKKKKKDLASPIKVMFDANIS